MCSSAKLERIPPQIPYPPRSICPASGWSRILDKAVDKAPDAFRTISEVADELDLPQHVLRFWETRFAQIKPMKRGGGRRYYRPDDVDLLRGIRHLLYGEGYTIRGVQRILKEHGVKFVADGVAGRRAAAPTNCRSTPTRRLPVPACGRCARSAAGAWPVRNPSRVPREVTHRKNPSAEPSPEERTPPRVESGEGPGPLMPLRGPCARTRRQKALLVAARWREPMRRRRPAPRRVSPPPTTNVEAGWRASTCANSRRPSRNLANAAA